MKEEFISIKYLRLYKVISAAICLLLFCVVTYVFLKSSERPLSSLFQVLAPAFFIYLYVSKVFRLSSVSYDDQNLYVHKKGRDIIVPFEEVKYIRVENFVGIHVATIRNHPEIGDKIRFKPSILYPLNFWKVDNRIDELKALIAKCKNSGFKKSVLTGLSSQY